MPLLSWLLSRGRCRFCNEAIGTFYPVIELAAFALALWAASVLSGWLLVATCALGWALLTLAIIDWRHFLLPDALTLAFVPGGLLVAYGIDPELVPMHGLGAALGFLSFTLIAALYRRLRGRAGLGAGDAKLLAGAGAWVSVSGLASVVLVAALAALAVELARSLRGRTLAPETRVPFGSYLALGTWLVWLYGPLAIG